MGRDTLIIINGESGLWAQKIRPHTKVCGLFSLKNDNDNYITPIYTIYNYRLRASGALRQNKVEYSNETHGDEYAGDSSEDK
jgi:hypothetical protein